ncbi:hypothetical protein QQF64_019267 [Cirrhinus molitorella]|uniref:Uncharacterized protein n=1 Tax=Cirrhinus molitorella TaxID=172907 RepID=A0ABR3LHE9_9TELE
MSSWGSQADLADELKKGLSLSRSSVRDESELLEDDVVSLTSSDPGASALLGSTQEEQEMSEGEEAEAEPSQTSCPAYEELLEVMDRATDEYVACGMADWKGDYVLDKDLQTKWCKPTGMSVAGVNVIGLQELTEKLTFYLMGSFMCIL